jgi:hypothetical protein
MSYEESYRKAFLFNKMVSGMLDPEMIEDTAKIVNEAVNDKFQVNLIINNRAGGNAPPDRPEDGRQAPFTEARKTVMSLEVGVTSSSCNPHFLKFKKRCILQTVIDHW